MPCRIWWWAAAGVAVAVLAWAVGLGAPADSATLFSRLDVVGTALVLAGTPLLVRRWFGPTGEGWLPRTLRVTGYLVLIALVLVKAYVERFEFASRPGDAMPSGLWLGEAVFLVLLAAYVAGLLAVTTRRPWASPASLAIGTGVGLMLGLTIYVVRPLVGPLPAKSAFLSGFYGTARVLAVPLIAGAAMAAGLAAARRTAHRDGRRPLADPRARAGVVAGLCAGAAAALLVSVMGLSTIAIVPHLARGLQWSLPSRHLTPGSVYAFEVGISEAAAGYLLVLLFFPLLGAGLGAWGGLYGSENPGQPPGGGGGGGPRRPRSGPPPGSGGRDVGDGPRLTAMDMRRLLDLPEWQPQLGRSPVRLPGRPAPARPGRPAQPDRPERAPTQRPGGSA